jgi:hypothetical protein
MADGYTKLYADIVDSSIWKEDSDTCKVWITLLALCNAEGFVRGSVGWLASKAKVSTESTTVALTKFLNPDPESRTEAHEGRRLEQVERGWLILNYTYFRNEHQQLSTNPRRVYQREWMRKKRLSTASQQNVNTVNTASASVSASVPVQGKGCGERDFPEVEIPSWQEVQAEAAKIGLVDWKAKDWFDEMQASGWMDRHNRHVQNWRALLSRVRTWWEADGRPMTPKKARRDRNGQTEASKQSEPHTGNF